MGLGAGVNVQRRESDGVRKLNMYNDDAYLVAKAADDFLHRHAGDKAKEAQRW
jgi:hypothetical protein